MSEFLKEMTLTGLWLLAWLVVWSLVAGLAIAVAHGLIAGVKRPREAMKILRRKWPE